MRAQWENFIVKLAIVCAALVAAEGVGAQEEPASTDGPYSYSRRGSVNELQVVRVYLLGQAATDYAAIENSGLSKRDVRALKTAAATFEKSRLSAGLEDAQKVCNEGPSHAADPAAFRAFLAHKDRDRVDADTRETLDNLKTLSNEAYVWLQGRLASIAFHTTTAGDYYARIARQPDALPVMLDHG